MHFVSQITLPPPEASRVTVTRVFQQPARRSRRLLGGAGSPARETGYSLATRNIALLDQGPIVSSRSFSVSFFSISAEFAPVSNTDLPHGSL
jgi:hypothetical protein